jgi:hypothetical protein
VYDINTTNGTITIEYPKPGHEEAARGEALSQVATNSTGVMPFLNTMANEYTNTDTNTDTIPLYVLATAGMRLVDGGEATANKIYGEMMNNQNKKLYPNRFYLVAAMTISGQYEGLYAWIAANHKNGKLGTTTDGILEIGGASMQIAFATTTGQGISRTWSGTTYTIYSKSYLGGGVDQVFANNTQPKPNFGVQIVDVSSQYGDTQFLGLGRPIGTVLDSAGGNSVQQFNDYASSLTNNDSEDKYHPWTNAKYIAYVVDSLKLGGKLSKPVEKSDWTEGAALDILINGEKPEGFNYNNPN